MYGPCGPYIQVSREAARAVGSVVSFVPFFATRACSMNLQSHRLELYRSHALQLLEVGGAGHRPHSAPHDMVGGPLPLQCGAAYPCFCSKERLQSLGRAGYDGLCKQLPRLLALEKMKRGHPHTIRLQVCFSAHILCSGCVFRMLFVSVRWTRAAQLWRMWSTAQSPLTM